VKEVPIVPMPAHLVLAMAKCVSKGAKCPGISDTAVKLIAAALTDEEAEIAMEQASRHFVERFK
jgi:hypothetical protein